MAQRAGRSEGPSGRARGRVMLVDGRAARRLGLVSALRESFEVHSLDEDSDLLREVRARRPELVIISIEPAQLARALRNARVIQSDPTPPRVGLLHGGWRPPAPSAVLPEAMADGYLTGPATPEQVHAWARRLLAGEQAVEHVDDRRGLLQRLLHRG